MLQINKYFGKVTQSFAGRQPCGWTDVILANCLKIQLVVFGWIVNLWLNGKSQSLKNKKVIFFKGLPLLTILATTTTLWKIGSFYTTPTMITPWSHCTCSLPTAVLSVLSSFKIITLKDYFFSSNCSQLFQLESSYKIESSFPSSSPPLTRFKMTWH